MKLFRSNDKSITKFYEDLYDTISTDSYSNSYKDYKYSDVSADNELYIALSQYTPECKLISDFNSMCNHKYIIKNIKDIIISDVLVKSSPRGARPTGLYNMSFTVCYTKQVV